MHALQPEKQEDYPLDLEVRRIDPLITPSSDAYAIIYIQFPTCDRVDKLAIVYNMGLSPTENSILTISIPNPTGRFSEK